MSSMAAKAYGAAGVIDPTLGSSPRRFAVEPLMGSMGRALGDRESRSWIGRGFLGLTWIVIYLGLTGTCGAVVIPDEVAVWGNPNLEAYVNTLIRHDGKIYLGGQKMHDPAAPDTGRGFVCRPLAGVGCSSGSKSGVIKADQDDTSPPVVSERQSMVEQIIGDGDDIFIAGKALNTRLVYGCGGATDNPMIGTGTNGWIQSRPDSDLRRPHVDDCRHGGFDGNDEALALALDSQNLYWGGTVFDNTCPGGCGSQNAVVYLQDRSLDQDIYAEFEFVGAGLSEVFDIEVGDVYIFVTGRADTDFLANICMNGSGLYTGRSPQDATKCTGAYGGGTTRFVSAHGKGNLDMVWMHMDDDDTAPGGSLGSSQGAALHYYRDGSQTGLIVAGFFPEAQKCTDHAADGGIPDPLGTEAYSDARITYYELAGLDTYTSNETKTSITLGTDCQGEAFTQLSVKDDGAFAVGASGGPEDHGSEWQHTDALLAGFQVMSSSPWLTYQNDWLFAGTAGVDGLADMDRFLDVHAGVQFVYVGGETQSGVFEGQAKTGLKDAVYLKIDRCYLDPPYTCP